MRALAERGHVWYVLNQSEEQLLQQRESARECHQPSRPRSRRRGRGERATRRPIWRAASAPPRRRCCCSAAAAAATILVWIYCCRDRMHSAIEIDGVEHMTVDWKDTSREAASMLSTTEDSALATVPSTTSRPGSASAASSRREGLLYAVASAVTGSITITLSKITMLLVRTTIEGAEGSSDGADSNQLLAPSAWGFILGLACW